MFHYLAFVWDDDDVAARETARRLIARHALHSPQWEVALNRKGLFVGCAGARVGSTEPYHLEGEAGVVLGKLFERPSNDPSIAAPLALDESRSREILKSRGRRLIDHYWGRYVAFLHDDASRTSWVLRDPSGGLPCLTLRFGGLTLYFSAMNAIQHLGLGPFDVNWGYLAAWICMMRGPSHVTALRQVSQVLAGECIELRGDRISSTFYWDALQIANSELIEDPAEATRALRDCVLDTARAWASCYSGIALSLSGGVDSSILYAALRDSPAKAKLTCFHYYPIGSDLDERHFARLVAQSGGSKLIEHPRDPNVSFEPLREVEASHTPSDYLYRLERSRLDAQVAAEHGATAMFTGWGGDQLFYQSRGVFAAGDYLHYRGLDLRFLRIAFDSAQMDRVSVWHVLRKAFAECTQQEPCSFQGDMAQFMSLIHPDVMINVNKSTLYVHPFLSNTHGTPSGKLWHILNVLSPWEFYDPLGRPDDPEIVAPLYSQPILERCLRIPVHVLTLGGWDRAIARRAFHELPREIANRKNKGSIDLHIRKIFDRNNSFLRGLLLDGGLVREGILDRKKLTTVLSGKASKIHPCTAELLDSIATEAWLRRWRNQGWRAAA